MKKTKKLKIERDEKRVKRDLKLRRGHIKGLSFDCPNSPRIDC